MEWSWIRGDTKVSVTLEDAFTTDHMVSLLEACAEWNGKLIEAVQANDWVGAIKAAKMVGKGWDAIRSSLEWAYAIVRETAKAEERKDGIGD